MRLVYVCLDFDAVLPLDLHFHDAVLARVRCFRVDLFVHDAVFARAARVRYFRLDLGFHDAIHFQNQNARLPQLRPLLR